VEKAVTKELNDIIVSRNYPLAGPLFAVDAIVRVPAFNIVLQGREAIVLYLYLGDPAISDQYQVISSEFSTSLQELSTVVVELDQVLQSVRTGAFFSPYTTWKMTFNNLNQIAEWVIGIDSLAIQQNLAGQLDLNTTSLCTLIQTRCTGTNQQYADQASCEAFMNSIPLVPTNPANIFTGLTVTCRSFHSVLFQAPDPLAEFIHCPHAGMNPADPLSTPCYDWFGPARKRSVSNREVAGFEFGDGAVLQLALDWWCANGEQASHDHIPHDHRRSESETRYCFTLADAGL
jgi:hypothetical protein